MCKKIQGHLDYTFKKKTFLTDLCCGNLAQSYKVMATVYINSLYKYLFFFLILQLSEMDIKMYFVKL